MKVVVSLLTAVIAQICIAVSFQVPQMPQSQYADTEVATNFVVSLAAATENRFRLFLELDAATNNCVFVEFGVDQDLSGALERNEVEFSVGWDCGEWVWRDRRSGAVSSAMRGAGLRRLEWTLLLKPDKTARHLAAEDGGTLFEGPVPATFYSPAWNMARIVRRGPEQWMCATYDLSMFPLTIKLR